MSQCEDEWTEIQQRFDKEGLDFDNLCPEERVLHVWRWLGDAESNLRSSRRQLDKLRDLRSEELEEMESYIGHVRELAQKRTDHLETETMSLRSRLENSQQQAATLTNLLERSGLDCIAEESLGEQVAFLIADRAKLIEEIDILKNMKFSNGVNGLSKEGDLLTEIIKVSSEKEVLRREVAEMYDRVQLLEKASRQLELDNERLAFKLSEALAELEERETQLKHLGSLNSGEASAIQSGMNLLWPGFSKSSNPAGGESPRLSLCRRSLSLQQCSDSPKGTLHLSPRGNISKTNSFGSGSGSLPRNKNSHLTDIPTEEENRPIENDTEIKEPEYFKNHLVSEKDQELKSLSFGADSTPPSLLMSEFSCGSPKKLANLLDSQIAASRSELIRLEEIKKLQSECENLKSQLSTVSEKYNSLVLKHIQYKSKRKAQVDDLRNRLDVELSSLQCQVDNLQSQLSVQRKMLAAEENFRERIEADYRQLQEEKRSLMVSVMHLEASLREKELEITVLGKKITLLENANSDLLAKVLQMKYLGNRSKYAGVIHKSNSVEGVLMDLGTV